MLVAIALFAILGINAFRELPIEAYPDVGDPWVQVITQWPGHAPEEVERQITIPIEREMGPVAKKTMIRSVSIAGLSVVTLIFEDSTDSALARQQVLEHLSAAEIPDGASPELGPLASPIGEIMRYRLVNCARTRTKECTDEDAKIAPRPLLELKDLQDWVVSRELLGVPGVADISTFGGTTKQYQLAIVVVGGLVSSLTVSLFMLPALYKYALVRKPLPDVRTPSPSLVGVRSEVPSE